MTPAEERFLERCHAEGEAWFVPAQTRMVRRLLRTGLLSVIPKVTRYNPLRGSHERRATPKGRMSQVQVTERNEALEAALGPPGTECCQGGRVVAPLCTGCPDLAHPRRSRQRGLRCDSAQEDEEA